MTQWNKMTRDEKGHKLAELMKWPVCQKEACLYYCDSPFASNPMVDMNAIMSAENRLSSKMTKDEKGNYIISERDKYVRNLEKIIPSTRNQLIQYEDNGDTISEFAEANDIYDYIHASLECRAEALFLTLEKELE